MQLRTCIKCKSSFRVAPPNEAKAVRCPKCKTVNQRPAHPPAPKADETSDTDLRAHLRLAVDESTVAAAHNASQAPSALGQYKILAEIGRGGMGVVLKAHDDSLNRDVAIKMLRSGLSNSEESKCRFVKEA